MNILLTTDSYKTSHHKMLPEGCTLAYGNATLRSFKFLPETNYGVSFGQQLVTIWLHQEFEKFFKNPNAVSEVKEVLSEHLGIDYDVSHFEKLHKLGYLPLKFKSIEEGSKVPVKTPILTWYNTHPDFAWLPLYLETPISNMLWKPVTTATIASLYRENVNEWVSKTDKESPLKDFMIHDFSSRGMSSVQSSMTSGVAFLASSMGTDNLPALYAAKKYYNTGVCAYSVFASEHSVSSACISTMGEQGMIEYYMNQYPDGILSIVSDTLDLTKVVKPLDGGYLFNLKDKILKRNGKIVVRPDSSPYPLSPVEMICGYDGELTDRMIEADYPEFYKKGLIECLWDIFGGSINSQGYKVLDPHIGAIYGEAINLTRQVEIYKRLAVKGFAATNIVMGIGSYTLNMNSRDTLGIAMKATYVEIDGEGREIFKDPITDDGTKKSAKGLLMVEESGKLAVGSSVEYNLVDQVSWEDEGKGALQTIYKDGKFYNQVTLTDIRKRLNG